MPIALVISRKFPPIGSAGASIRLVKFIKYIAQRGWEFVILTQHPEKPVTAEVQQSSFMELEIPAGTIIERIPAPLSVNHQIDKSKPSTNRYQKGLSNLESYKNSWISERGKFLTPFLSFGWGLRVLFHGIRNMKKWNIDIIYSVTPTLTNALIGASLSWFSGKPLILDMKDDWVGSPDYYRKNFFRQKIEPILESTIIQLASKVILVTEGSYQLYLNRYEFLETPDKFHFVPNGCDLNEYRSLNGRKRHIDPDRFVILSAASGYKKDYRDITPFFLAIQNFLTHQPSAKKKLEIIFLGKSLSKEYNSLLEQIGIIPYIRELDAVVREDFIQWLWRADLFFLVQPKNNKTSISGTLYEYWATGKAPTLLIAETGSSTSLVENYSLGKAFHFKEVDGISNFINEVYTNLQNLQPMYISSDGIEFFDRKHLAQKMVNIWQDCLRDLHHG